MAWITNIHFEVFDVAGEHGGILDVELALDPCPPLLASIGTRNRTLKRMRG
jgi:hypothetical protein